MSIYSNQELSIQGHNNLLVPFYFCNDLSIYYFAVPFSPAFTASSLFSPSTDFLESYFTVVHPSTTTTLISEAQSSTQLDIAISTPSNTNMFDLAGENISTSMTGMFTYIIVGSVVGFVIITCSILVMVTLGILFYIYRRNRREKHEHKTGKSFSILYY